jgi:Na+/H+ antiporter NhaD/arsenite permease-like protein
MMGTGTTGGAPVSVESGFFPLLSVAPFIGLLLAIATLPLAAPAWWHANRHKALVAAVFGLPVAVAVAIQSPAMAGHAALEYAAFMALIGSLFVISGGIRLTGSMAGTPLSNTALLALGALLANIIGTTGAAMILIRPFLRANRAREARVHQVIFFIFIVANAGGCLTPLGDPPLFLGFLKGVPFTWTLRLWAPWLMTVGVLLFLFNLIDQYRFNREELATPRELMEDIQPRVAVGLKGAVNILLLAGVVGIVLAGGVWVHPRWGETTAQVFQAAAMAGLAALSLAVTPAGLRAANGFTWHPLVEVAVLFAGIFAAMIPALAILRVRGPSLGLSEPWQFFWATGVLSAFLDNAPTYLSFLSMAQYLPDEVAGTTHAALAAISCGAVFFGAATYIGNGPNFMVNAIAEEDGVRMPSFGGYLLWSGVVLLPLLIIITLCFFRGGTAG